MKVNRFATTAITYLLTIFLFDQSIAFAQQGAPSTPQIPIVDSNKVRVEQQAAQTTEPQVGDLRLEKLIEQALANNPEIKSMQRRFDMMRARIPQAKALDEPMLSIGWCFLFCSGKPEGKNGVRRRTL
jgi:hypothetical protein